MPIETMSRGFGQARRLSEGGNYGAMEAMRVDKNLSDYMESRQGQTSLNDQIKGFSSLKLDAALDPNFSTEATFLERITATSDGVYHDIGDKRYQITVEGMASVKDLLGLKGDAKDLTRNEVLNAIKAKFGSVNGLKERMAKEAALAVQEGRFRVRPAGPSEKKQEADKEEERKREEERQKKIKDLLG